MASLAIYQKNGKNFSYVGGGISVTLYDDYLKWSTLSSTANIYYTDITSVNYINGNWFQDAFIQVNTIGKSYTAKMHINYSNMNVLAYDIEKRSKEAKSKTNSPISVADEIEKLKKLADQGIITKAEFEAKKKSLLGI